MQFRRKGTDHLELKPASPDEKIANDPNDLATKTDRGPLFARINIAREVCAADPVASMITGEYSPDLKIAVADNVAILECARNSGATIYLVPALARLKVTRRPSLYRS